MRRYTYSSVFATLIIAAAEISTYWNLPGVWQFIIFYALCPVVMVAINWIGVKVRLHISCSITSGSWFKAANNQLRSTMAGSKAFPVS
jgi:hypothetical protein